MCDPAPVRSVAALLAVGVAIAGCGGLPRPTAKTGCKGLRTPRHPKPFAVVFAPTGPLPSLASVCAAVGEPRMITHNRDGSVRWTYGSSSVTFRSGTVVEWQTYDRNGSNTYGVGEAVQIKK